MKLRAPAALLAFLAACNAQFKATGFGGTDPQPTAAPKAEPAASPEPSEQRESGSAKVKPEQEAEEKAAITAGSSGQSVTMWQASARASCARELNYKACDAAPETATPEQVKECRDTCRKDINDALARRFGEVAEDCLDRYVAGEKNPTCAPMQLPGDADPGGNGAGWPKAKQEEVQAFCDKTCRDGGPKLLAEVKAQEAAEKEGYQIVMAYKRCMHAVASTHQAVSYRVHDRELYDDLMSRTDAACRKKHKCDTLEDPAACYFGND